MSRSANGAMTLGERAARCYVAGWRRFQAVGGLGWVRAGDGFLAACSGLADPEFNEVFLFGRCGADEITRARADVMTEGAPFALRARPALVAMAATIADGLGMAPQPGVPLMALTQPPTGTRSDQIELRRLGDEENEAHVAVAADAFDGPVDLIRALTPPSVMSESGVHVVGGLLDGEIVATAVVDVHADAGWMFNVATLGAHRRRGFGSAVTAAAADWAFADGASAVFLLSSALGEPVYIRVGFRCVEHWSSWYAT